METTSTRKDQFETDIARDSGLSLNQLPTTEKVVFIGRLASGESAVITVDSADFEEFSANSTAFGAKDKIKAKLYYGKNGQLLRYPITDGFKITHNGVSNPWFCRATTEEEEINISGRDGSFNLNQRKFENVFVRI